MVEGSVEERLDGAIKRQGKQAARCRSPRTADVDDAFGVAFANMQMLQAGWSVSSRSQLTVDRRWAVLKETQFEFQWAAGKLRFRYARGSRSGRCSSSA